MSRFPKSGGRIRGEKRGIVGKLLLVCAATFLAAAAAQAQKVTVEFDRGADFSRFKTFAIRAGELNSRNAALNSDLVRKQINDDIARGLTARGLMEVRSGPADLNVRYTFGSARRTQVEAYPAGWYGRGTRYVRVPYAEGTLVIDFRDPATRSLVWRSVASENKSDPVKLEGKLDDMVKKSIEKYPPKAK
ncbi:MAG TPA: DUF4136 domain-containing protein [Terriglobales bacterium]|jgi:hypothetical protein|nr:DUF4136 domain-containing protein [Terriglobales bacterium]